MRLAASIRAHPTPTAHSQTHTVEPPCDDRAPRRAAARHQRNPQIPHLPTRAPALTSAALTLPSGGGGALTAPFAAGTSAAQAFTAEGDAGYVYAWVVYAAPRP